MPKFQSPRPSSRRIHLRQISLTATLAKLLESFVGLWILERVGDSLVDPQFGGHSGQFTPGGARFGTQVGRTDEGTGVAAAQSTVIIYEDGN